MRALVAALALGASHPALAQDGRIVRCETPPCPTDTVAAPPTPAVISTGRAAENAVTQAEDAFGVSIGRETIGIYNSSSVRGFSPFAAGNVRIDGLYFDPFLTLIARARRSTTIRIGLSALGFPFPSPTGIVDYQFRKPHGPASASALASIDSYGAASVEVDAVVPLDGERLGIGFGAFAGRKEFYNATNSFSHNEAVMLRWRPTPDIELAPFWTRSEVHDDEAGPIYIPAGPYLPPPVPRRRYDGPGWTDYDSIASLHGVTGSIAPAADWLIRGGLFRSLYDDRSTFSHLLLNVTPDGAAERLIIADPRSRFVSISGELRVTRSISDGPRLHVVHLSARARDRRQRYDGSVAIDYGPTRIGERFEPPEPDFAFGEQTSDSVKQSTGGIAYEGRWRGVGELGFGISKTDYRKRVDLPGLDPAETRSRPWLYNVAAAAYLTDRLSVYGGYARGLEESGVAPANAVNRNEPLPAILTSQRDAGFRYAITPKLKLIGGVFDLRKPYYNLDQANRFALLGDIKNQGIEVSLSGALTPRLDIVTGAVLLRPRVTGEGVALGRVGRRPVNIPARSFELNADWRLPWIEGISLDVGVSHSSERVATRDNLVSIPARTIIDLGGRYRFKLSRNNATLRASVSNVTDIQGFDLRGAGAYDIIPGRVFSTYLAVDF